MDLKDEQWKLIEPILGKLPRRADGRGRPWQDSRKVLDGILWVLRTGAPWKDLPPRYPPYQTCHRRFKQWSECGKIDEILWMLAEDLRQRGQLDLSECFIDGTFAGAKKGGFALGIQSAGKGPRSWQLQTALVFLSPYISIAPLRMRSNWFKKPLITDFSMNVRDDL
jgi:transposase